MTKNFEILTLDPKDPTGSKQLVTIPSDLIAKTYKFYSVRYENFRCVEHVLMNPKRIFHGVRLLNLGFWCYTGKPDSWYVGENRVEPFPKEKVFAVYLNSRFILYDYRAEDSDSVDAFSPHGWEDRFGGLIWKSTS